MTDSKPNVVVVGAGLVGCLFALRIHQTGLYNVSVYEKRQDSRSLDPSISVGKSINLALSVRGLTALGEDLSRKLHAIGVKMPRRIIHRQDESIHYQDYGRNRSEYLLSVSRRELNELLLTEAENAGVKFYFGHKCIGCDLKKGAIRFTTDTFDSETVTIQSRKNVDLIVGADGAFSAIRQQLSKFGRFNLQQKYISHGYSQFTIPAREDGGWELEDSLKGGRIEGDESMVQGLHIWSRNDFMMIALPNRDCSYTVTLFFRFKAKGTSQPGYDQLNSDEDIINFFKTQFPDAARLMPTLVSDFRNWKPSGLVTVKCSPHHFEEKCLLIGDAAHAIVPFYGQGVNAGFEDVRKFFEIFHSEDAVAIKNPVKRLSYVLPIYTETRKKDLDTICDLAIEHFEDMKRNTTSADYYKKNRFEHDLHENIEGFTPLYSLVTFSNRSYYESLQKSKLQQSLIQSVLNENPLLFEKVYGTDDSCLLDENAKDRVFLINEYKKKVEEHRNLLL